MSFAGPVFQIAETATSQIGQGRWLPDQSDQYQYLSAAHGLLTSDFNRLYPGSSALTALNAASRLGWGVGLSVTAALPDLADFASSRLQAGWTSPITVNQSISLFDSITKGTAYGAAFMLTRNADIANGASTLAGMAASVGRDLTMPLFQYGVGASARAQLMDGWSQSRALGQTTQSFSQWVGGTDEGRRLGFTPSELSSADNLFRPPSMPDPFNGPSYTHSFALDPLQTMPGHMITGAGSFFQMNTFNRNDPTSITQTTWQHYSYTDTFSSPIDRPSLPDTSAQKPMYTPPVQTPDFTNFVNSLKQTVGNSVGYGSGSNPGGFRTGIATSFWEDGEWPVTPWYGLGYVVNDQPAQAAREDKQ
jgi:hypothetical protein